MNTTLMKTAEPSFSCQQVKRFSAALAQRARNTLSRETGFIANSSFDPSLDEDLGNEAQRVRAVEQGVSISVVFDGIGVIPGNLAQLCDTPILTREEEIALFRRMNFLKFRANVLRTSLNIKTPDAKALDKIDDMLMRAERIRNHIIQSNIRLVISITKTFANKRNPFDDLLSEGITAMMRAVEKFDYDRGFRFSTYATRAIRCALYRHIQKGQKVHQRFATNREGLDAVQSSYSETDSTSPLDSSLHHTLSNMLLRLNTREQLIMRMRFGLEDGGARKTFADIGEALNVSKERARQISERAMGKLRSMTAEFGLDSFIPEG